jgi:hypothetical protein
MYDTNRTGTSQAQHKYVNQLWAQMRQNAHEGGARWVCAYEENWAETKPEHAESEIVFAGL